MSGSLKVIESILHRIPSLPLGGAGGGRQEMAGFYNHRLRVTLTQRICPPMGGVIFDTLAVTFKT